MKTIKGIQYSFGITPTVYSAIPFNFLVAKIKIKKTHVNRRGCIDGNWWDEKFEEYD